MVYVRRISTVQLGSPGPGLSRSPILSRSLCPAALGRPLILKARESSVGQLCRARERMPGSCAMVACFECYVGSRGIYMRCVRRLSTYRTKFSTRYMYILYSSTAVCTLVCRYTQADPRQHAITHACSSEFQSSVLPMSMHAWFPSKFHPVKIRSSYPYLRTGCTANG
jgi:hypothetical protein